MEDVAAVVVVVSTEAKVTLMVVMMVLMDQFFQTIDSMRMSTKATSGASQPGEGGCF